MQPLNQAAKDAEGIESSDAIPYANQYCRLSFIRNEDQQSWQAVIVHLKSERRYCFPATNLQAAQQFVNTILRMEDQPTSKIKVGWQFFGKVLRLPLRRWWPIRHQVSSPSNKLVEVI